MNDAEHEHSDDELWADLTVLAALDALDPAELTSVEEHLESCPHCRALLERTREAAVGLSEGLEADPPADLRRRVLDEAATTLQRPVEHTLAEGTGERGHDAPVVPLGARRDARGRRLPTWAVGLIAAAAVGVGAVAVTQLWPEPEVGMAQQVLDADDAARHTAAADGASLVAVQSAGLDRVVLVVDDMPQPPAGRVYQLWFVHADGSAVSAGLMPSSEGRAEVLLEGAPAGADAVGITVEQAGGAAQPTTTPIAVVPLKG